MPSGQPLLRLTFLLLLAALGVHELRYLLAFGQEADAASAHHGHGYLSVAGPLVGLLSALGLSALVLRAVAVPFIGRAGRSRPLRVWLVAAGALLALYTGQELVEGYLAAGHPPGLEGVFGAGGWLAVPLSLVLGVVVALAVRAVEAIERAAHDARLRVTRPGPRAAWVPALVCEAPVRRRSAPLARRSAGRAPPSPVV